MSQLKFDDITVNHIDVELLTVKLNKNCQEEKSQRTNLSKSQSVKDSKIERANQVKKVHW